MKIGYVEAIVRIPLIEGDNTSGTFDWFEYREPGIQDGAIGVCSRKVELVEKKVVLD